MSTLSEIKDKLVKVFDEEHAIVLAGVIFDSYNELVKTSDFNELKGVVKELGVKVGELTDVQKRTEVKMGELVEAQKRTDVKMGELAEAQRATEKEILKLTKGLGENRGEIGGLSKSMSYAFENEAYRMLPGLLKKKYGIEIKERIIRADIGGKEVNIFGKAEKDGKDVIVVGEAKLRLDERREKFGEKDVFEELDDKVDAVRGEYGGYEITRILITHYATKGFLEKARQKGVIVLQSFEW